VSQGEEPNARLHLLIMALNIYLPDMSSLFCWILRRQFAHMPTHIVYSFNSHSMISSKCCSGVVLLDFFFFAIIASGVVAITAQVTPVALRSITALRAIPHGYGSKLNVIFDRRRNVHVRFEVDVGDIIC
jgi:hypothetical protein